MTAYPPLGEILARFAGRRVLVTGHSGFVGTWLSHMLVRGGAIVYGLALPSDDGSMSEAIDLDSELEGLVGDVRNAEVVASLLERSGAEIVFHLAAQALVLPSLEDPIETFSTNVVGTATVLDALRTAPSVRACVVVTSDKCYATASGAHQEDDPLGGDDPYSASKGASELVTHAFRHSYFADGRVGIATARAGNIVGGGDFAAHRIVPDCVRAVRDQEPVRLRHPEAIRPWQHVLDAVGGYLRLGAALLAEPTGFAEAWNFGPPPGHSAPVGEVVATLHESWRSAGTEVLPPVIDPPAVSAEREVLTLVSEKAAIRLGWTTRLPLADALTWSVDWYGAYAHDLNSVRAVTDDQIARYLELDAAGGDAS